MAPNTSTSPDTIESDAVILKPVRKKAIYRFFEFLCWEVYRVMPLLMPPADIVKKIVEKLLSWPNKATPGGPIITAITFTLTKPVNIFMSVATAFKEETFTKSVDIIFLILAITFCYWF